MQHLLFPGYRESGVQLLAGWLKSLDPIVAYVSFCFSQPMQAPVCRPFWTWVMIGISAFGLLMLLVAVWRLVSCKLKVKAALRAQQERAAELPGILRRSL